MLGNEEGFLYYAEVYCHVLKKKKTCIEENMGVKVFRKAVHKISLESRFRWLSGSQALLPGNAEDTVCKLWPGLLPFPLTGDWLSQEELTGLQSNHQATPSRLQRGNCPFQFFRRAFRLESFWVLEGSYPHLHHYGDHTLLSIWPWKFICRAFWSLCEAASVVFACLGNSHTYSVLQLP